MHQALVIQQLQYYAADIISMAASVLFYALLSWGSRLRTSDAYITFQTLKGHTHQWHHASISSVWHYYDLYRAVPYEIVHDL